MSLWGVEWCSVNELDGETREFVWDNMSPVLFRSRREARSYIRTRYRYLVGRRDLRQEPHGWKMPQAYKVTVEIKRAEA